MRKLFAASSFNIYGVHRFKLNNHYLKILLYDSIAVEEWILES